MNIPISGDAPPWAQQFAVQVGLAIEMAMTRPLPVFTTTTMPSATDKKWLWRPVAVSNGAGNRWIAISNGAAWRYADGTAV